MQIKTLIFNTVRNFLRLKFLEKILVNLTIGRTIDSFLVKLLPNNYQYPKNSIRNVSRNNVNYQLYISDLVDWHVYFGIREIGQEKLMNLCKDGDYIIDVGANIGSVMLNLAKRAGSNGKVYGFEPDLITYDRCLKNILLNNLNNIILINEGLGSEETESFLYITSEYNRGMNKIKPNIDNKLTGNIIRINTLDNFITNNKISKVDLIKIDVEGYELSVLKGAEKTIQKMKPLLFIEVDDNYLKEQGSSARELVSYIKEELNYLIFNAHNDIEINIDSNFTNCHFDAICKNTPNYYNS